jgi:hypothetical protein
MILTLRVQVSITWLAFFLASGALFAQSPSLPPAPVPAGSAQPGSPESAPPPSSPSWTPVRPIDPPPIYAPVMTPQGYPEDVYLLPARKPTGLFLDLEVGVVGPHVHNRLSADVQAPGFTPDTIQLPNASLDWTGSPRVELGYHMPCGRGDFLVSYRSLVSEGSGTVPLFDGVNDGFLHSRLNMNVVDLLYRSPEVALNSCYDWRWKAGARLAANYFDTEAATPFLSQWSSNHFVGAGPFAGLEVTRKLIVPELRLLGAIEGAAVFGHIHQSFGEVFDDGAGNLVGAATDVNKSQTVPVAHVQLGLSYAPSPWYRIALGYEFEEWWNIGKAGNSRADILFQGIFLRGEFDY